MIDLSFIDSATQLTSEEIDTTEMQQLVDIAKHIGSFQWSYDGDNKLHDGPIAQALLLCPGLKDAVHKDENGILSIDTNFIALATLGYVAAICRKVSGIKLESPQETLTQAEEVQQNESSNE